MSTFTNAGTIDGTRLQARTVVKSNSKVYRQKIAIARKLETKGVDWNKNVDTSS